MAFSVSGRIAAGADQALEEVLDRRLKEATRQQIERQNAIENQMRQQGIDLQRESAVALEKEREEDRKYRTGQTERADAEAVYSRTAPGEISPQIAEALKKSPTIAPLIGQKKILEGVRPIAGTAPLDMSGPQQMHTLEATPAQAEKQLKTVELKRITDTLRGKNPTESQRRALGFEAAGAGVAGEIPAHLFGQTGEERTAQTLAAEQRANAESDRRSAREHAQQLAIANRPPRTELSPSQKFQATRALRNDFVRETKSAKTVTQQYAMMKDAWAEIEKGNVPASSQAMITIFNKILDPDSVVREGEYALSEEGQSYIKRLESQWQKTIIGGNIVVPELKKFMDLSKRFHDNAVKSARESGKQIDSVADEFKLNKSLITRDYDESDDTDVANEAGPQEQPKPGGGRLNFSDFAQPPQR